MKLPYTAEHDDFRTTVRRFIDKEIAPHHAQWEKDGVVSRELWRKAGAAGLLLTDVPDDLWRRRRRFPHHQRADGGIAARHVHRAGLPRAFRHRRPLHPALRQRSTEAALAAAHGQRRCGRRDRHDRARHRQRPAGRAHHGDPRWRRLRHLRAEDIHYQRPACRPDHRHRQDRRLGRREGRHADSGRSRPRRFCARPQPGKDRPEGAGYVRTFFRQMCGCPSATGWATKGAASAI